MQQQRTTNQAQTKTSLRTSAVTKVILKSAEWKGRICKNTSLYGITSVEKHRKTAWFELQIIALLLTKPTAQIT